MRSIATKLGLSVWICALLAGASWAQGENTGASQTPSGAADDAGSLFELLELVRGGLVDESAANEARLEAFVESRDQQAELLAAAEAELAAKEDVSDILETTFNEKERTFGEAEAELAEGLGQMGEVFGVVRQVANDASGQMWDSVTSSQLGDRKELLDRLGRSKELPSTEDLELLWYVLQR
ncbi:hypothetical protein MK280_09245, partial [Myxococcota bacterium]|nr:hypothetical protein [Myxococcota bacterium]